MNITNIQQDLSAGRNIGIVKLASIGDIAMAIQALRDFSTIDPSPKLSSVKIGTVHWFCGKDFTEMLEAAYHLLRDEMGFNLVIHPVDHHGLLKGSFTQKVRASHSLFAQLGRLNLDAVFILHQDSRYRWVCRWFYDGPIFSLPKKSMDSEIIHETERYRGAFKRYLSEEKSSLRPLHPQAREHPEAVTLGLLPGGGLNAQNPFVEKRWPHWKELIVQLLRSHHTAYGKIFVFGDQHDLNYFNEVISEIMTSQPELRNRISIFKLIIGQPWEMTLKALAELDFFLSVDTGLAHLAALLMKNADQKIVTLFGPTNYQVWSPSGQNSDHGAPMGLPSPPRPMIRILSAEKSCAPCYKDDGIFTPCPLSGENHRFCMKDISVEEVLREIRPDRSPTHQ